MNIIGITKNPQVVFKKIGSQVSVLNTDTTELFILDDLASSFLLSLTENTDISADLNLSAEEKGILDYLLDMKILLKVKNKIE